MRTYIGRNYWNKETIKQEFLNSFPSGDFIYRKEAKKRKNIFLAAEREFGNFKSAYHHIYGREYIDKRTIRKIHSWGISRFGEDNPNYGNKMSDISKEKIRKANTTHGESKERNRIRASYKGKIFKLSVYKRDNFKCQICENVGGTLNAHHIKEFAKFPELRFDINNGITLCKECHIRIHKVSKN